MKKLLIIVLLFASCKKEQKPIVAGGTYTVIPGNFSGGVWQPKDTLYAYSIYFNAAAGLNYCSCGGPGKGTPVTVGGAKPDSLNGTVLWDLPVDDLF